MTEIRQQVTAILDSLGVSLAGHEGRDITVRTPITGDIIATLQADSVVGVGKRVAASVEAFEQWRQLPAPVRGECVRLFGEELRRVKPLLAELVMYETGKIPTEAAGEVQEMIDICDYAVGLSRMLGGHTFPSERPQHSLEENWEPLGPVLVISAFNFPVAVWAWNAAIALVAGNSVLWKPSEKTPLTALAAQAIFQEAYRRFEVEQGIRTPAGLVQLVLGDRQVGEKLVEDKRIPIVSATGSTAMGRVVGIKVAERMGKSLLELGGNNAAVMGESADLEIALPSILFGAIGTAGQRCTTTRRLFVPHTMYDRVLTTLQAAYASVIESGKIGDPRQAQVLVGPLIDIAALERMQAALEAVQQQGGTVYYGEALRLHDGAAYVQPALVRILQQTAIVKEETFAPILYVIPYSTPEEAIEMVNDVAQGLSASIFTTDIREAGRFKRDVVAGIVNVNAGTSGAEIGGAFGGEKETGGGRESGSDAWKQYMRRVTTTSYYGNTAPALAQGVKFTA